MTHEQFLNMHKGSYGPAIKTSEGSFTFPVTLVKGILLTGYSFFTGIVVPAVAEHGFLTTESVSFDSIKPQLKVLENLRQKVEVY